MTIYVIERKEGRRWVQTTLADVSLRGANLLMQEMIAMHRSLTYRVAKYVRVKK